MSVPIVIDEWLFHDLLGENKIENQAQTLHFLVKLLTICDRIVIVEDSPFQKKTVLLIKRSENNLGLKGISQFFNSSIVMNSSKTLFLRKDDIKPLPSHLAKLVPIDDQYLFQAQLKVEGSFILTTDGRWSNKLLKQKLVRVKMRDQFITEYLK